MKRLRILFSGMIAGTPRQGGATWAVLQYVLGFRRLGHEVCLVEPVDEMALAGAEPYFREVTRAFGLDGSAALVTSGSRRTIGPRYAELLDWAREADLLVNVSGMLSDEKLVSAPPVRLFLDLDPAFNQLWHTVEGVALNLDAHTHFATVGQALARSECDVPTVGVKWISTLPPVVMDEWSDPGPITHDAFTTVANWRSYGSIQYRGVQYGQKAHSLRSIIALPTRSDERFLLALSIHPDERRDLEALRANSWELVDPADVASTPEAYRRFVGGSKAELGIAKSGYVASRCGWFSDRSACYLASGRPVIAQETGFGRYLPTGSGLFSFETVDDILAAVAEINSDYDRHAGAAREIAATHFDSDVVLPLLLEQVGVL